MTRLVMKMVKAVEVKTEQEFRQITASKSENATFVLNFWASWAAPCAQMNDVFHELSIKFPTLHFLSIEAEEVPEISEELEVAAVPCFVVLRDGKVLERLDGANAVLLTKMVETHAKQSELASLNGPIATSAKKETVDEKGLTETIKARLAGLIGQSRVMLFMKGAPDMPQCGFSRQIVQLFRDRNLEFGYFDILSDETVRQSLKIYSDWPTYPQVYVSGEMVGGLDIVKEIIAADEFDQTFRE